ncbi:MAG: glycosyltransferase [Pseudomonadota bacterium]
MDDPFTGESAANALRGERSRGLSAEAIAVDVHHSPGRAVARIIKLTVLRWLQRNGVVFKEGSRTANWLAKRDRALVELASDMTRTEDRSTSTTSEQQQEPVSEQPKEPVIAERLDEPKASGEREPTSTIGPSAFQRTLFIDARHPDPTNDSGSIDTVNYISWLRELGQEVDFISDIEFHDTSAEAEHVRRLGARVIDQDEAKNVRAFLDDHAGEYGTLFLSRVNSGGRHFEAARAANPQAAIIFNTVDLHHVREDRQSRMAGDVPGVFDAARTRERELYLIRGSDLTIVVSAVEREQMEIAVPGANIESMPLYRDGLAEPLTFHERDGVGFVGSFEHEPNVDAVRFLLSHVWPVIRERDQSISLEIVGRALPDDLALNLPDSVSYLGHVDDLEKWLERRRLTVAPLRYGAGAKGKVATSVANCVPVVGTSVAFEGMELPEGARISADAATEIAAAVVRLHNHESLWSEMSEHCAQYGIATLSTRAGAERFKRMFSLVFARVHGDRFSAGNIGEENREIA